MPRKKQPLPSETVEVPLETVEVTPIAKITVKDAIKKEKAPLVGSPVLKPKPVRSVGFGTTPVYSVSN